MDLGIIVKLVILSLYGGTGLPTGSGQPSTQHPLLVTTCQVMKQIANDMSAAIKTPGAVTGNSCYLSTNCTQVLCGNLSRKPKTIDFLMEVLPCKDPLSIRIVRFNDTRITYESFLYKSQMIGLDLGSVGFTTLNFTLAHRITQLSIGIKVDKVDLNQGTVTQFISQQEIPVDVYSCPEIFRPQSENCQVIENIAQYLNYFFASVIKMNLESTPDCIPSTSCNDVECVLPSGGYYKYSLMVCQTPPALRLLKVLPNGTTSFQHITDHSDVLTLPQAPEITLNITLNITFKRIDPSTIGLGLSFSDGNKNYTEIPYIEVPVNKSACAANYTRTPLVSSCEIMPLLASPQCSVNQPNCDTATCQVAQLNGSIEIELYSCFVPPAVALRLRDNQGNLIAATRRTSESNPVDNSMLFFTVVEHADESSVGVQVSSNATNESYIRYLEIPVNRSSCPQNVQHPSTITCETMSYIAQYLTVFFANVTRQREATPECMASEPNCNNVTCTFIDNSCYSIDILPCASPTVMHLELHAPNGTTIVKHTFTPGTQTERLDENTQVKVTLSTAPDLVILEMIVMYDDGSYSFTLPAIPNVLVPLDTSGCKQIPPTPSSHMTHASTAAIPQSTLLAIEIGAPIGGLLLAIICIMCCVIMGLCVRQSQLKNTRDNYNFQRLSIVAQNYDDEEEDDEEDEERQS